MSAYWTPRETAAALKLSVRTLRRMERAEIGPKPVRLGKRTKRYRAAEVAALAAPAEVAR